MNRPDKQDRKRFSCAFKKGKHGNERPVVEYFTLGGLAPYKTRGKAAFSINVLKIKAMCMLGSTTVGLESFVRQKHVDLRVPKKVSIVTLSWITGRVYCLPLGWVLWHANRNSCFAYVPIHKHHIFPL